MTLQFSPELKWNVYFVMAFGHNLGVGVLRLSVFSLFVLYPAAVSCSDHGRQLATPVLPCGFPLKSLGLALWPPPLTGLSFGFLAV